MECHSMSEKLREATRIVAEAVHDTNPVPAAKKVEVARPEFALVQNSSNSSHEVVCLVIRHVCAVNVLNFRCVTSSC